MSRSSKSATSSPSSGFLKVVRRIFSPPVREFSRLGRIVQTLWDAAQLQSQKKEHYRRMGMIAAQLVKESKLQNISIERTLAKIDQIDRILKRQELLLKSYQARGDVREILKKDRKANESYLEPV